MKDAVTSILDPLYGPLQIPRVIGELIATPTIQRLRHVRLSNIDSISMTGISGLSRFEHAIGVSYLSQNTELYRSLSTEDALVFAAAALLHDSAITPFGHLIEEAFNYSKGGHDHERKWQLLRGASETEDPGGLDNQVYLGRESGLRRWADLHFGSRAVARLEEIIAAINGQTGPGQYIKAEIDLDNLDNVVRIAFHMGLDVQRDLPLRIARSITGIEDCVLLVERDEVASLVTQWLDMRKDVYEHLMLSREDFAGKLMLIHAARAAIEVGELGAEKWKLSDWELLHVLANSSTPGARETTRRWLLGDLWQVTPLYWLAGRLPPFSGLPPLTEQLGHDIGRLLASYRIMDKINREATIAIRGGPRRTIGKSPAERWLLGFASADRKPFSRKETDYLFRTAADYFHCQLLGIAARGAGDQEALFAT